MTIIQSTHSHSKNTRNEITKIRSSNLNYQGLETFCEGGVDVTGRILVFVAPSTAILSTIFGATKKIIKTRYYGMERVTTN